MLLDWPHDGEEDKWRSENGRIFFEEIYESMKSSKKLLDDFFDVLSHLAAVEIEIGIKQEIKKVS